MTRLLGSDRIITTVLSWVAGYVDTAGFLSLNGLFTAHVTGNLVVAGAEIAGESGETVWVRLAIIPVFLASVVLMTIIAQNQQPRPSSFLWFEAIGLLIFTIVSVKLVPNIKQPVDAFPMFVAGSTGVFAMGVQNVLMRETLGHLAQTTVMTGNLTQFTIDFVRLGLIGWKKNNNLTEKNREIKQRINKFIFALIGFILGAAFGAFFTGLIGFWSILLPTAAIAFLALYIRQYEQAV